MILSFERRHSAGFQLLLREEGDSTGGATTSETSNPSQMTQNLASRQGVGSLGETGGTSEASPGLTHTFSSQYGGWSSSTDPTFNSGSSYNQYASPSSSYTGPSQAEQDANAEKGPLTVDQQKAITGGVEGSQENKSLLDRFGIKPGMSKDQFFAQETPAERDDRMRVVNENVIAHAVKLLEMATPLGTMKNIVRAFNQAQETGDWAGSAKDLATGYLTGKAMGIVNQGVAQAIGPDASKVLSQYNQLGTVANAFGAGVPTINPAGVVAGALGLKPGASLSGTGANMIDGTTPQYSNGSSGGGSGRASVIEQPAVQAPAASTPATSSTDPIDGSMGLANSSWYQAIANRKHTSKGW